MDLSTREDLKNMRYACEGMETAALINAHERYSVKAHMRYIDTGFNTEDEQYKYLRAVRDIIACELLMRIEGLA